MIDWLERADAQRVAVETPEGMLTYGELRRLALGPHPAEPLEPAPTLAFAVDLHARLLRRPQLVVHTSGTSGEPTPVTLTQANIEASARGTAEAMGLDESVRWLCPLPLNHVGGLMVLLRAAFCGFTAVLGGLERLGEVSHASLVPTQLKRLLDGGFAGGPEIVLGGAAARRDVLARVRGVRTTYGLTQACSMVTLSEPGDLETSGAPIPGARVEIAPDGEILVRGAMVAGGGTLHTGDLGHLADGRLVVSGRKDDLIVTGGENVQPAAVEAVLLEHPDVAEAAVFGRPDPEWGQAVTARVVAREGRAPDPEALLAHCRERLPRHMVPKAVELSAEPLPRTRSGKLLRRLLV